MMSYFMLYCSEIHLENELEVKSSLKHTAIWILELQSMIIINLKLKKKPL